MGTAADLSAMIIGCFTTGQAQAALDLVETIVEAGHRYDKAVLVHALPSLAHIFPKQTMWEYILKLSKETTTEDGETHLSSASVGIASNIYNITQSYYFFSDKLGGQYGVADVTDLIQFYRDHSDQLGVMAMLDDIKNVIKLLPAEEKADFFRIFLHHPKRKIRVDAIDRMNEVSGEIDLAEFIPDLEKLKQAGRGPTLEIDWALDWIRKGDFSPVQNNSVALIEKYISSRRGHATLSR